MKTIVKIGDKFNNWEIIKEVQTKSLDGRKFLCRNSDGIERIVRLCHLKSGASKGYLNKGEYNGNRKHGYTRTRIYRIWRNMKNRCSNPKSTDYKHYGGKGISYCIEWENFKGFFNDMSSSYKDNLSLDRIDVNGNYSKENCRWATNREQALNKIDTIYINFKGKNVTLVELSEKTGIKYITLYQRIFRYKMLIEKAVEKKRVFMGTN